MKYHPVWIFISAAICALVSIATIGQASDRSFPRLVSFFVDETSGWTIPGQSKTEKKDLAQTAQLLAFKQALYGTTFVVDCRNLPSDYPEEIAAARFKYLFNQTVMLDFKCVAYNNEIPLTVKLTTTASWSGSILRFTGHAEYEYRDNKQSIKGIADEQGEFSISGKNCIVLNYRYFRKLDETARGVVIPSEQEAAAKVRSVCEVYD